MFGVAPQGSGPPPARDDIGASRVARALPLPLLRSMPINALSSLLGRAIEAIPSERAARSAPEQAAGQALHSTSALERSRFAILVLDKDDLGSLLSSADKAAAKLWDTT